MPKEPTNDRSTLVQVMTVPNNPLPEPMLIRSHNGLLQSATIQPFTLNLLANTCPVIWIFPQLENYSSQISFLPRGQSWRMDKMAGIFICIFLKLFSILIKFSLVCSEGCKWQSPLVQVMAWCCLRTRERERWSLSTFLGTEDIAVHISRLIITYTLE